MTFQSTLPRRERQSCALCSDTDIIISIHAPAKGATTKFSDMIQASNISIHAPAKGATNQPGIGDNATQNFNPRSREGSDFCFHVVQSVFSLFQSTLPRRERLGQLFLFWGHTDFNPRSREGSDSAHPRTVSSWYYFNPRSREGSDYLYIF